MDVFMKLSQLITSFMIRKEIGKKIVPVIPFLIPNHKHIIDNKKTSHFTFAG